MVRGKTVSTWVYKIVSPPWHFQNMAPMLVIGTYILYTPNREWEFAFKINHYVFLKLHISNDIRIIYLSCDNVRLLNLLLFYKILLYSPNQIVYRIRGFYVGMYRCNIDVSSHRNHKTKIWFTLYIQYRYYNILS